MTLYIVAIGIVAFALVGCGMKMQPPRKPPSEGSMFAGCIIAFLLNGVVLWALIDALVRYLQ